MKKIVIAAGARTPFGSFQGALSPLKASEMGATAIKAALERANIQPEQVDSVFMGNVLPAGMGQAPARQAVLFAGVPKHVPAVTLNKICGSGLEAVIQAFRAIAVGDAEIVVAGGMESMTNAPYALPNARGGYRLGNGELIDTMVHDGLWDVYNNQHMGSCAELCATHYSFSREDQDAYAIRSFERAQAAQASGFFADEMVSIEVKGRKSSVTVSEDEGPGKAKFDKIPQLCPAFDRDNGTITAANASTINDGAVAMVITSEETANAKGMPILATIEGYSSHAHEPEMFTTAPVSAMQKLYDKLGWSAEDVDIYEINEAFAVVPMAAMQEFNLPAEKVNVNGGAISLGHPLGASGARILLTLIYALKQHGGSKGMASICIGGGEALAMAITLA